VDDTLRDELQTVVTALVAAAREREENAVAA
jgi:hypothetical protein